VRLNFSGGGATNIYTWSRDAKIMDIQARPFTPTELIPSEAGEWRAFDGRSAGLRLTVNANAATAITPHGRMTLAKP